MIKPIVFLALAMLLAGCEPQQPKEVTYLMPAALSDCKVHAIDASGAPTLYVVRCAGAPNGKTTETSTEWSVQNGKTRNYYHSVLIDGVEYAKPPEKSENRAQQPAEKVVLNGVEYVKVAK